MSKRTLDATQGSSASGIKGRGEPTDDVIELDPVHEGDNKGFTFINGQTLGLAPDHPLASRKIFLCSENMVEYVASARKVGHIVTLNTKPDGLNEDLPDTKLKTKRECEDALALFRDKLAVIDIKNLRRQQEQRDIIIHCRAGMCRTPTAALIYLIDSGVDIKKAHDVVVAAMRERTKLFKEKRFTSPDYNFVGVIEISTKGQLRSERDRRMDARAPSASLPVPSLAAVTSSSSPLPVPHVGAFGLPPLPSISPSGLSPMPSSTDVFSLGLISPAGRGRGRGRSAPREPAIVDSQKSEDIYARSRSEPSRNYSSSHRSSASGDTPLRSPSRVLKRSVDEEVEEKQSSATSRRGTSSKIDSAPTNPRSGEKTPRADKGDDEPPPSSPRL